MRLTAAACVLPSAPHLRVAPLARSYEVWQHSAEKETREYINGKHQRKRGRSLQDGASLFPENAWVHVAVVHGGDGTATLFLNGSLCARGPVALPSHVPRGAYLDYTRLPTPSTAPFPAPSPPPHAAACCVSCVPKRPTAWQQTTTWDGRTGGVTRFSRARCATCW